VINLSRIPEEFLARIKDYSNTEMCWEWTGGKRARGYAKFHRGKSLSAHRYVYSITIGRIPEGMEVHHTCLNKSCVNPSHLELKTLDEHRRIHH